MIWDRKNRLEAILKEKIAVIVQQRLNDPRIGFVTITRTSLSKDRRIATVYYTVLGDEAQRRTTARALADAVPHVQEQLSPTLAARIMPELRFVYDETVERESRLVTLIEDLAEQRRAEEAQRPAAEPAGDGEPGPDPESRDD